MNSGLGLALLIRDISSFMIKRVFYLLAFFISIPASVTTGQQASVYKVERLSINSPVFSEISPVIVKDGLFSVLTSGLALSRTGRLLTAGASIISIWHKCRIHLTGKSRKSLRAKGIHFSITDHSV